MTSTGYTLGESMSERTDDDRLVRIEQKVDKLSDAMVNLVRLEERLISLFRRLDTFETRIDNIVPNVDTKIDALDKRITLITERLNLLERKNYTRDPFFTWIERIAIALIGAGAALAVRLFSNAGP